MANNKTYRYEWDRPVEGEFRIDFGNPTGAAKPRRVTAQHVREFNTFMEAMAKSWWESVDKKKPYAVALASFRSRYHYVAVDTADDIDDADEAATA